MDTGPNFPKEVEKSHLVVAIPTTGRMTTVRWGFNLALQDYPLSMSNNFLVVRGAEAGEARNRIAEQVLAIKSKLVWMLDDDVLPPQYAVQKLMFAMLNKPDVMACAGIVYTKSELPSPLVFGNDGAGPYYNWKKGKAFEVPGFISTGCMLIRSEVFEKVEYPWFKTIDYPDKMTEDAYFCMKVIKAGYKILGHGGVLCGHYDGRTRRIFGAPKQELVTA